MRLINQAYHHSTVNWHSLQSNVYQGCSFVKIYLRRRFEIPFRTEKLIAALFGCVARMGTYQRKCHYIMMAGGQPNAPWANADVMLLDCLFEEPFRNRNARVS